MVKPVESEIINETCLIQIIKIEQTVTTFKKHVLIPGVAEAMQIWLGQNFYYLNPQNKGRKRPKIPSKMVGTCPIRPKWLHRPCTYAALIFSRSNLYIPAPWLVPGKISFELPPLCQTSLCLSLIM